MNIEPISFYEMMRASHVKRWHIINTSKEQNLAEHQWNVTVIGLQLAKLQNQACSQAAVLALMFHDVAEIRYGDIPTPGKAFMRKMLRDMDTDQDEDFFEFMDATIVPAVPFNYEQITSDAKCSYISTLIHVADTIEAAWWLRENGQGTHATVVADKLWRTVVDQTVALGWYDSVNGVLQALGMPHISKDMADNPP